MQWYLIVIFAKFAEYNRIQVQLFLLCYRRKCQYDVVELFDNLVLIFTEHRGDKRHPLWTNQLWNVNGLNAICLFDKYTYT